MLRGRGGGAVVVSCRGGKRGVVHTGDLCGSVMAKEVIYQTEILEGYRLDSAQRASGDRLPSDLDADIRGAGAVAT